MNAYICLPRPRIDDDLLRNDEACRLYLYLLAKADDNGVVEISVRQFSKEFGTSYQRMRSMLNMLQATQKLTQRATQGATQLLLCVSATKGRTPTQKLTQRATQDSTQKKSLRFTPPSQEEVIEHWKTYGYHFNPESFIPYYQSKGWKVGEQPMKDWKAAMRTWEIKWKERHGEQFYYQANGQSTLLGLAGKTDMYSAFDEAADRVLRRANGIIPTDDD